MLQLKILLQQKGFQKSSEMKLKEADKSDKISSFCGVGCQEKWYYLTPACVWLLLVGYRSELSSQAKRREDLQENGRGTGASPSYILKLYEERA